MDTGEEETAGPIFAKAKHAFNGKNNDELSFETGDVIAITQQIEGGWWEGTLNEVTGWFPSAYVTVISEKDKLLRSRSVPNTAIATGMDDSFSMNSTKKQFITMVLDDFLKSEQAYIMNMKKIVEEYFAPLHAMKILTPDEFSIVEGNLSNVYALQATVFLKIKEMSTQDVSSQRVGHVLLTSAGTLKDLLVAYCENHPSAVAVINNKSKELEAFVTSVNGDMKTFIMGLSEPFRHLSKYPNTLQELHRNMHESHADRGDLQRSATVYRDLKEQCESVRRQKEMQLEFGVVAKEKGWTDSGKIERIGAVSVSKKENEPPVDRFVALFSRALFILELSADGGDYTLIEQTTLLGCTLRRVPGQPVLNLSTATSSYHLNCGSAAEVDAWMEAFERCGVKAEAVDTEVLLRTKRNKDEAMERLDVTLASLKLENSMISAPQTPKSPNGLDGLRVNHELEMVLPDMDDDEQPPRGANGEFFLRPFPAYRCLSNTVDLSKKSIKLRKEPNPPSQETGDEILLSIIEEYLGAADGGQLQPHKADHPQLIVADDEKFMFEEVVGGQVVITERSLVDTVYAMKDQIDNMQKEIHTLRSLVEKEQRARRRLEDTVKHSSLNLSTSTPKPTLDIST